MNLKFNTILMTLVCTAPILNILFDYFLLNKKPSFISVIATLFAIIIYMIFIYSIKKQKN